MQLSDARELIETSESKLGWMLLTNDEVDVLMNYVDHQESRQECCYPYDCMCHERCDGDFLCGSCKEASLTWASVNAILKKSPMAYRHALALRRVGEQDIIAQQLQNMKDLEAVGDYAAAQRIWEGDGE